MPLVQMPAVVAYRGVVGFGSLLFISILTRYCDFDALLRDMPGICTVASKGVEEWKAAGIVSAEAVTDKHEAVLVGWSPEQQRMIAREYRREGSADHSFAAYDIEHVHIGPWDESLSRLPDPRTRGDIERLARAQVALMREKTPDQATGGKLFALRIGRHRIQTEEICDLDAVAPATRPATAGAAVVVA